MRYTRRVGTGSFLYDELTHWGSLPGGWSFVEVAGVAVDSQDRVYVFSRSDHPVTVFNPDGTFLGSWGEGKFKRPHAMFMAPDDTVFCVDDIGHAVYRFTLDGRQLLCIETAAHPADTGYDGGNVATVVRSGPPFNTPTAATVAPDGSIYVSDGYGNARVHRFSADGKLLRSWGDPGREPGQFITPHDVYVDADGRVYISDRQNCRIQIFTPDGELSTIWNGVHWPCDMCHGPDGHLYIAEVGGVFMGPKPPPDLTAPSARITIRDMAGAVLCEWTEQDPRGAGRCFSPHGIACDSQGNLYVGEVIRSYPGGAAPPDASALRKYARV
jgi:sugar lactone lactonase YvrE